MDSGLVDYIRQSIHATNPPPTHALRPTGRPFFCFDARIIGPAQNKQELSASSKTLMAGISEAGQEASDAAAAAPPNPARGDAGGGGEGGGQRVTPAEAEFRREMAQGRPVVGIGGVMGDSSRSFTGARPSLRGFLSSLSGRRGGGVAGGDGGNPAREQQQEAHERRRRDGGGGLNVNPDPMMFLVGGDRESESWSSIGSPFAARPPRSPSLGRRALVMGRSSSKRRAKRGQGGGVAAVPPPAPAANAGAATRVSAVPKGGDAGGMERGSNARGGSVDHVAGSDAAGAGTAAATPLSPPAAAVTVPTPGGVTGTQAPAVATESSDSSTKAE